MNCFVADAPGLPRRRFYIFDDKPAGTGEVSGWSFVVDQFDERGEPQPYFDTWEEHFSDILRYPSEYADGDLVWRREGSGEVVDLMSLNFGSRPIISGADLSPLSRNVAIFGGAIISLAGVGELFFRSSPTAFWIGVTLIVAVFASALFLNWRKHHT